MNEFVTLCETWEKDGITYAEMCRQSYVNLLFSAGTMSANPPKVGHERNEVFFRFARIDADGNETGDGGMLELTRDELAAIAWVCNGALWSVLMPNKTEGDNANVRQSDETTYLRQTYDNR